MRKILSLLGVLLLVSSLTIAQERTVTGRVTDGQGKPIPFASVTIKGSTTGVAADENGNFTIQAPPNSTLVFSAAGYQPIEIKTGTQASITATLNSQAALSEVVVTALGIRRARNTLPYSAQQVTSEEMTKTRTDNFANALSGKVAGLQIKANNNLGGSTNIILRGYKSITGNNQALIVVDGVPVNNSNSNTARQTQGFAGYDYGNTGADVNPDDIESVTILKGAASTALYGSRAANGVILITTKKGRRGHGISVNLGASTGRMDKSTWIKYQHEYGAGYYDPDYYRYSGASSPNRHFWYLDANGDGAPDLVVPTTEDASFGAQFDPGLMVYQWNAFDPSSPNYGKPTPWVAAAHDPTEFFETPVSSSTSVFVDGGGDRTGFKLGYTRNTDKGILPNSNLYKNMLNLQADFKITDKLTAIGSVNFTRTDGKGRYGSGYDNNNMAGNFRQWWQMNVDVLEQKAAYERTHKNVTWNMSSPPDEVGPIYWDNPYYTRYESYESDNRNRFISYAGLDYALMDWLRLSGRVSMDTYDGLQEERQGFESVNLGGYSRYNQNLRELNYNAMANMDRDITSGFNLKALVGTSLRRSKFNSVYAATNGGIIVPGIFALSNSTNPIVAPTEQEQEQEIGSVFGGLTFTYNDMLILDATGRMDKSSTLPSNNNTYFYPSVSLGFVFSKLLPGATWLSHGKLRLNYAEVGSDAPFDYLINSYDQPTPFNGTPLFSVNSTLKNAGLKPERTNSYEAGIELSMLRNRIGLDVTYFKSNTLDQIIPVTTSAAIGFTTQIVNAGNVENKGIEVALNLAPVKSRDFGWNMNINWSKIKNEVLSLYGGTQNILLGRFQGGVTYNAVIGQPYGVLKGSDFVYTNGEKTVDVDGYYMVTQSTNNILGNVMPDWTGGINNILNYKALSLSFLVDFKQGGSVYSVDQWYGQGTGLTESTAGLNDQGKPKRELLANGGGVIFPGVTVDGKPNTIHALVTGLRGYGYNNFPNAGYIYDASYIKLREVNLSFGLPDKLISHLKGFKGVNISLYGRNLWIIHKNLPDADPEEGPSSGNVQGVQVGSYPTYRTAGINLNFKF